MNLCVQKKAQAITHYLVATNRRPKGRPNNPKMSFCSPGFWPFMPGRLPPTAMAMNAPKAIRVPIVWERERARWCLNEEITCLQNVGSIRSTNLYTSFRTKQKQSIWTNENSDNRIEMNCKLSSHASNSIFFPIPDMIEHNSTRGVPALAFSSPTSTALANRSRGSITSPPLILTCCGLAKDGTAVWRLRDEELPQKSAVLAVTTTNIIANTSTTALQYGLQ